MSIDNKPMKSFQKFLFGGLLILALGITAYFVITALQKSGVSEDAKKEIVRLESRNRAISDSLEWSLDSMAHYRVLSDTWFRLSLERQKTKIITITKYNEAKAKIDSLPSDSLSIQFARRYSRAGRSH